MFRLPAAGNFSLSGLLTERDDAGHVFLPGVPAAIRSRAPLCSVRAPVSDFSAVGCLPIPAVGVAAVAGGPEILWVTEVADTLAQLLYRYLVHLQSTGVLVEGFDGIVPVPLHRTRYLFRGFNQAELLAAPISKHFGWPLLGSVIARRRAGRPQVGRGKLQRQRNVRNAFTPLAQVTGRRLLLLDDVVTTGSTLTACAAALRRAGAQSVTALALAHG